MNPFSSCFVRPDVNAYRFATDDERDQRLRDQCFTAMTQAIERFRRIAIIGPHGTGKSTLLNHLQPVLASRFRFIEWLKLSNDPATTRRAVRDFLQRMLDAEPSSSPCIIIDGFEQLNWLERTRLNRLAKRIGLNVVITSHIDQRGFVTVHRTAWNHEISQHLTAEKLSGLPGDIQSMLFASYQSKVNKLQTGSLNLRELWFIMYDEVERLRKVPDSHLPQNASYRDVCSS